MSALAELRDLGTKKPKGERGKGEKPARQKSERSAYLFLLPWFLGIVVVTIGPMLASLVLSFTKYNLLQPATFNGLDNIVKMINDTRLHTALGVTSVYVLVSVPIQLAFALLVAILLNRGMRGLAIYRSIFYLPSLIGGSVAIAVLWREVFGTEGLINQLLGVVGIEGIGWISTPATALSTLITLNVWTFGAPMVIFLAGLRQIPRMYYEAAEMDGASPWRRFISVTLPLLTPIIFFNLVLQVIHAFQTFTQAFIVSGGTGGPADSTLLYSLYLYQRGFTNFDMGYASALAWLLLLIVGALTAINFWASKFWVHYDD
jgi:multiple sugar transport system permease protein